QSGPFASNLLDVLANDSLPFGSYGPLRIESVELPANFVGTVMNEAGRDLIFTALDGFTGTETFEYTVDDAQAFREGATVTGNVTPAPPVIPRVDVSLQLTRPDGSPATSLQVGQDFVLHVQANDLSSVAAGIQSAYVDLHWDSTKAIVTGPLQFGYFYFAAQ